jgi:hypothetical protein
MNILRDSIRALAKSKRVWLLQFLVNPVLILAAALWLLIPEAQIWQIVLTVLAVLFLVLFFLWLHAATFSYFAELHAKGAARFRGGLPPANLIAFTLWALIFAFLLHVVQHLSGEFQPALASYLRSISPAWLRRTMTESRMDSMVALKFWVLFWIIIPAVSLPIGLQTAIHGFGGFGKVGRRGWRRTAGNRVYWSVLIVLAILGVYLPGLLIAWLPKVSSVTTEGVSLVLRLLLAWFLAVSSWTSLASLLGRLGHSGSVNDVAGQTTN